MAAILQDIRIVDWTTWQQGPYATAMLADLGAEVIHIEQPVTGDSMRGLESRGDGSLIIHGHHVLFEDFNRNKKGMMIDMKKPKGREAMYRLVSKSDVFVTNFRPKNIVDCNMEYNTLTQYNPRIIYAAASGFGRKGPDKDMPTLDLLGLARSGIMLASGEKGMPPIEICHAVADRTGSIILSYGILAALLARERLGIGQEIHSSMLGGMMTLIGSSIVPCLWRGEDYVRADRLSRWNPLYNYYECKDGRWIVLGMLQSGRYWRTFCGAIDLPELQEDHRFLNMKERAKNREALTTLLDKVFAARNYEEWAKCFTADDIVFGPMNTIGDLSSDPQVIENDMIVEWEHPGAGPIKSLGFPVEFSKTPADTKGSAPVFGQHTEEILTEICGYSWEDIAKMKDEEVI